MNKYIADFKNKLLRGPAEMELPKSPFSINQQGWDKWDEYIASLPAIPAEWLKDSDDGRLLEDGKDFRIEETPTGVISGGLRVTDEIGGKGLHRHTRTIAVPIDKQKVGGEYLIESAHEACMLIIGAYESHGWHGESLEGAAARMFEYAKAGYEINKKQDKQEKQSNATDGWIDVKDRLPENDDIVDFYREVMNTVIEEDRLAGYAASTYTKDYKKLYAEYLGVTELETSDAAAIDWMTAQL